MLHHTVMHMHSLTLCTLLPLTPPLTPPLPLPLPPPDRPPHVQLHRVRGQHASSVAAVVLKGQTELGEKCCVVTMHHTACDVVWPHTQNMPRQACTQMCTCTSTTQRAHTHTHTHTRTHTHTHGVRTFLID